MAGSLRDFLKTDIVGFSEAENIQNFPSQRISPGEGEEVTLVDSSPPSTSSFKPKKVIFFDATARLDFVLMTRLSIVGFLTFALGYSESEYGRPINLNQNVKHKIVRKAVIPYPVFKDGTPPPTKIDFQERLVYDIYSPQNVVYTVSELWDQVVLERLLPELEKGFIESEVLTRLGDESIFIKDGTIDFLRSSNLNVFGHVKSFEVPGLVLSDKNLEKGRSGIYSLRDSVYSCYLNLESERVLFKKGVFSFSRVDVKAEEFSSELVDRFNFISNYLMSLTSVFSNSSRFPQNIPIIETLERFLRNMSGDRSIIGHIIAKSLKNDTCILILES